MEDERTTMQRIGQAKNETAKWIKDHIMYVIVFLSSLAILVFVPMVGSTLGTWNFTNYTLKDWVFYFGVKTLVAVLNTSIFIAFNKQGEFNSKDNKNYIKAKELLSKTEEENDKLPRSPGKWKAKVYTTKGLSIAFFTFATLLVFTNAKIVYDKAAFITYLITIIGSIVAGIFQMFSAEDYWCNEFYKYALLCASKIKIEAQKGGISDISISENIIINTPQENAKIDEFEQEPKKEEIEC